MARASVGASYHPSKTSKVVDYVGSSGSQISSFSYLIDAVFLLGFCYCMVEAGQLITFYFYPFIPLNKFYSTSLICWQPIKANIQSSSLLHLSLAKRPEVINLMFKAHQNKSSFQVYLLRTHGMFHSPLPVPPHFLLSFLLSPFFLPPSLTPSLLLLFFPFLRWNFTMSHFWSLWTLYGFVEGPGQVTCHYNLTFPSYFQKGAGCPVCWKHSPETVCWAGKALWAALHYESPVSGEVSRSVGALLGGSGVEFLEKVPTLYIPSCCSELRIELRGKKVQHGEFAMSHQPVSTVIIRLGLWSELLKVTSKFSFLKNVLQNYSRSSW